MKKLLLALLIATSISASAAPFQPNERKAVEAILKPWVETVKTNPRESMALMPQKFFKVMAKKVNVPEGEFKQMMLDTLDQAFEMVEITSYSIDLNKADVRKSNSGRDYAFIPQLTKLRAKAGGEEMPLEGYMLGIKDEGKWYFLNWDPNYAPIIAEIYPDLKNLKAPQ